MHTVLFILTNGNKKSNKRRNQRRETEIKLSDPTNNRYVYIHIYIKGKHNNI
jgi:hypothetical protein